jgi:Fe2+ or Zn2+ uptake regulation protein
VARYELAEELSEHHHQMVCSVCGDIEDVTLSDAVERTLREAAHDAGRSSDFEVETHRFELLGTCGDCG